MIAFKRSNVQYSVTKGVRFRGTLNRRGKGVVEGSIRKKDAMINEDCWLMALRKDSDDNRC